MAFTSFGKSGKAADGSTIEIHGSDEDLAVAIARHDFRAAQAEKSRASTDDPYGPVEDELRDNLIATPALNYDVRPYNGCETSAARKAIEDLAAARLTQHDIESFTPDELTELIQYERDNAKCDLVVEARANPENSPHLQDEEVEAGLLAEDLVDGTRADRARAWEEANPSGDGDDKTVFVEPSATTKDDTDQDGEVEQELRDALVDD